MKTFCDYSTVLLSRTFHRRRPFRKPSFNGLFLIHYLLPSSTRIYIQCIWKFSSIVLSSFTETYYDWVLERSVSRPNRLVICTVWELYFTSKNINSIVNSKWRMLKIKIVPRHKSQSEDILIFNSLKLHSMRFSSFRYIESYD